MTTTLVADLTALLELFSTEDKWGQGAYLGTRHTDGSVTWFDYKEGTAPDCMCLRGGIYTVVSPDFVKSGSSTSFSYDQRQRVNELEYALMRQLGGYSVIGWNDIPGRTFAEVQGAIKAALETAKAQANG